MLDHSALDAIVKASQKLLDADKAVVWTGLAKDAFTHLVFVLARVLLLVLKSDENPRKKTTAAGATSSLPPSLDPSAV